MTGFVKKQRIHRFLTILALTPSLVVNSSSVFVGG
jgi:hypothetical protein